MGANKNKGFCPLLDTGLPPGEVWVARKPARIHYTVTDMGAGAEGLARLKAANRDLDALTPSARRERAVNAFQSGQGDLLDDLRALKLKSIYAPGNDLTPKEHKKTVLDRLKGLVKAVWDSANLSD